MVPCIKDKCLKYPICISKRAIRCEHLFNYCNYLEANDYHDIVWKRLNLNLPNLISIDKNNRRFRI